MRHIRMTRVTLAVALFVTLVPLPRTTVAAAAEPAASDPAGARSPLATSSGGGAGGVQGAAGVPGEPWESADRETATGLTPERAVALALERHPAIRAADSGVEAAEAGRSLARTGWLPRVDLTQDLVRSTNPVFVFGSKLGQERFTAADFALESLNEPDAFTNSATRVQLRMSVWDAGRTGIGNEAALLGVEAARLGSERIRQQVAYNARRAFWGAVLAGEMLEVARSGERAAEEGLSLTRAQVEEGLAVPSDRMLAEVRLAEVREMRISAERQVDVAAAALREAIGAGPGERFELSPPPRPERSAPAPDGGDRDAGSGREDPSVTTGAGQVMAPSPEAGEGSARGSTRDSGIGLEDPGILFEEAMQSRSDLQALERDIRRAATGERSARSTWLPEVGVGAQYEWNADNFFGNDGNNWTVGASLRIPLFEGTETSARLDRARAEVRGLEAARERMVEGIRLEVISALAQARSAEGRLEVSSSAVEQAEESLRIVRERYAEGMAVVVELLDAEAATTRARGNRVAARHDLEVSLAALDLALGRTPGAAAAQQAGAEPMAESTCAGSPAMELVEKPMEIVVAEGRDDGASGCTVKFARETRPGGAGFTGARAEIGRPGEDGR